MRKRSAHGPGSFGGLEIEPVIRRAFRPVARAEVERRFRQRRFPPIVLILVSLVLWLLIGGAGWAIFKALN